LSVEQSSTVEVMIKTSMPHSVHYNFGKEILFCKTHWHASRFSTSVTDSAIMYINVKNLPV